MNTSNLIISNLYKSPILKLVFSYFLLTQFCLNAFSLSQEASEKNSHFSGNISLTNNGLSLIPTFSLGRPAAIFELSLGGERLSFDPEIRFAMDGQPWSFILWWRYKIIKSEKFNLHVGAHPAFIFRNTSVQASNGHMIESMEARRFFAGEIVPSYSFSDNLKVGLIYLAGRSLGPVPFELNQFMAVTSSFTNIKISDQLFFNARLQAFYLKMSDHSGFKDGYFASSSLLVGKRDFPIAIGSIVSRKIVSNIATSDWIWNLSLIYSFNTDFIKSSNPIL